MVEESQATNGPLEPTNGGLTEAGEGACYDAGAMTTQLDGVLKREIVIGGEPYTVTLTPQGLKLVPKGRRKGYELEWEALVSGEAALATALNASLRNAPEPARSEPKARRKARKAKSRPA